MIKKKISSFLTRTSVSGIVMASPFIIGFILFMLVPMGMSLYYSFCDYNIFSPPVFSGLSNIKKYFSDPLIWKSLRVTLYYTVASVPLKLAFALFVAHILKKSSKMMALYRALYYLPSLIGGSVAVSILWKRIFAIDGVLNRLLQAIGINCTFAWLGDERTAIWTLIILSVWQFGSSMLIFLSALKQIPQMYYEAARVDGASKVRQFFQITFPLLTPTIFFNLVMQLIYGMLAFNQCYIITKGQPMNSTLFYMVYMYQQSFEFAHMGYGALIAWVMLLLVGLLVLLLFATKKFWVYEGGY